MRIKVTGGNRLQRLENKLGSQDLHGLANGIAEAIAKRGEEIAIEKYGDGSIVVTHTPAENGYSRITASGEQVSFLEFGTGTQGEGMYPNPEALPKQNIEFESPEGVSRETKGWVYDYMKKLYQPDKPSFIGQQPQAQMFYTAEQLKSEIPQISKEYIRGGKK